MFKGLSGYKLSTFVNLGIRRGMSGVDVDMEELTIKVGLGFLNPHRFLKQKLPTPNSPGNRDFCA